MKVLLIGTLLGVAAGFTSPAWAGAEPPGCKAQPQEAFPLLGLEVKDQVQYFLQRLSDRCYVTHYGHGGTWYTAAEALGQLGYQALPALVDTMEQSARDSDDYLLMLSLYALSLASQDSLLKRRHGGDYLRLRSSLNAADNATNLSLARAWLRRSHLAGY